MESIEFGNTLLLLGAFVVLAGVLSSLVATRFGVPILTVFLVLGMLVGEDGPGGLHFNDYETTYLAGSLALAVILFDGGLRTKFQRLRGALAPSLLLATLGVLITAVLVAAIAHLVFGLGFAGALLLGAVVASTDAAAVFFLLRSGGLHLRPRVNAVLEVESGTNDPFAVFLTLLLTQLIVAPPESSLSFFGDLIRQAVLGTAFGVGGGLAIAAIVNRAQLPSGLHPIFVLVAAIFVYTAANAAGGSGFLAVYLAGLVLGNRPIRAYPSILSFHEAATWLCQLGMFLLLGLLVTPTHLVAYLLPALAVTFVLFFVARPIAVWLCLAPYNFTAKEKTFIAWVGLRGAVSIFLAAIPTLADVSQKDVYFNVAFVVVFVSLLLQGATVNKAARWLGLAMKGIGPDIARVELDIPGQFGQEMVGYPVSAGSFALIRGRIPAWARLVLIVRGSEILNPTEAGTLRLGDYAYVLAPPERVPRLDRYFVAHEAFGPVDKPLFGELPLGGDVRLGQIAELYELDVPPEDRELTIAEYFGEQIGEATSPGDWLLLGSRASLVARRVEEGRVAKAGLLLEELVEQILAMTRRRAPSIGGVGRSLRRFVRRLRRRLSRAQ